MDAVVFLERFLEYPSISTDLKYKEGINGAAGWVSEFLSGMGFKVEVVKTERHPIVYAKREVGEGYPRVGIYGHYDVQPVDPLNLWESEPFKPVIRDGIIYGRGASDNKGPLTAKLYGIKRALEEDPELKVNLTVIVEGEEEMGSPSFGKFLEDYGEELGKLEGILISDTESLSREKIVVNTGLRGLMDFEVMVKGPSYDLHSGLHGGAVVNPVKALCDFCGSLHGKDGRVAIEGFYGDVKLPEAWEREELKRTGFSEEDYKGLVGVKGFKCVEGWGPMEATRFLPTLEFNGIGGGYQGEGSKTIIPSKAFVKITCRLVPEQDPERIGGLLVKALEERMPEEVTYEVKMKGGCGAYLVLPAHRGGGKAGKIDKVFKVGEELIEELSGEKPLYLRGGGSIPIIRSIKEKTGVDCYMVGLTLPGDRVHAPNEHFDLGMLEFGIRFYGELLRRIGREG